MVPDEKTEKSLWSGGSHFTCRLSSVGFYLERVLETHFSPFCINLDSLSSFVALAVNILKCGSYVNYAQVINKVSKKIKVRPHLVR